MTRGYLCGKFMPATIGHARLIEFAMQRCDKLIVNIIAQPGEPFVNESLRAEPLRKFFKNYSSDKVEFVFSIVTSCPKHLKHGEADSSIWWGEWVKRKFGTFDYVFSSENYGELFAKTIGAQSITCDIERSLTPISATMCRKNPIKYFNYILPGAKQSSKIKICICGTESVGKTTLVKDLTDYFNAYAIYEHGAAFLNSSYDITLESLYNIQDDRSSQENNMPKVDIQNMTPIIFYDTDIITTATYEYFCLGTQKLMSTSSNHWNKQYCDLYIFLDNDAQYVNDNRDRFSEEHRNNLSSELYFDHERICKDKNIPFVKFGLNGSYMQRYIDVLSYINDFLNRD